MTRFISKEYLALIHQVQVEALRSLERGIPLKHVCADCGSILASPRVYCSMCESKGGTHTGCGSSKYPRGMLVYYGYEEYEG